MSAELGRRAEELASCVIAPLILGGKVRPVRPIGARLALAMAEGREIADNDLRSRIDVARVRRARLLAPVDTLPPLDASEWALAAGLSDLLQITNHELAGGLTSGRREKLLLSVSQLCERVPPPRSVGEALARHATFARAGELVRVDTLVSWWTGHASFRGQPPSSRLLQWPELRRVSVTPQKVPLGAMALGLRGVRDELFLGVLARWLSASPLSDLAWLTRKTPPFAWSAATLSLVATRPGRTLAFRAIARLGGEGSSSILSRANKKLESDTVPFKAGATLLAEELLAAERLSKAGSFGR